MLRFFRLIRRKLIEEQKTRQYIWYALGEILLVVFGILIALQINNWNQERQIAAEETRLLNQLGLEIRDAIISREAIVKSYNEKRSMIIDAINVIQNPDDVIRLEADLCSSLTSSHVLVFKPSKVSTIDELITSGSITNIQDDRLRNKVVSYNSFVVSSELRLSGVSEASKSLAEAFPNLIELSWDNNLESDTQRCITDKMAENQSFINLLLNNYNRMGSPVAIYSVEIVMLKDILRLINQDV